MEKLKEVSTYETRLYCDMYGTGGRIVSEVSESVSAVVRVMADGR